jgi:hypothetical protein
MRMDFCNAIRPGGRVVMQRPAKPRTSVRFRSRPPDNKPRDAGLVVCEVADAGPLGVLLLCMRVVERQRNLSINAVPLPPQSACCASIARMAKQVDARDLKSLGHKPCRFDSGSGHQPCQSKPLIGSMD